MNRILPLLALFILSNSYVLNGQIAINEVIYSPGQTVELINLGADPVPVGTLWLCSFPTYTQIQNMTVVSGDLTIQPGALLVVSGHTYNALDDELGLYTSNGFSNSANMVDYVEWGSPGHPRSTVAVGAGIWTSGDFVGDVAGAASLEYDGTGDHSSDWNVSSSNTEGQENSNVEVECQASAFAVGNQSVCPEETATFQVILTGTGPWSLSYSFNGNVQDPVIATTSPFSWQLSLEGTYTLMSVSDSECEGPAQGTLQLNILDVPTATVIGQNTFCSSDEDAILELGLTGVSPWEVEYQLDGVPQGLVTITDPSGGIPITVPGFYNLTSVSDANCQGEATGSAQVTLDIVDGGNLSSGGSSNDIYICVDDGIADLFQFDISGQMGPNSAMIVADESGEVLSLPTGTSLDFEGSGAGILSVWNISYMDGLTGLDIGESVPDGLEGCFALSNPIIVIKETGNDCFTSVLEPEMASFGLYPIPAKDHLLLSIEPDQFQLSYSVMDINGREILSGRAMNEAAVQRIDIAGLQSGLYLFRLMNEVGSTSTKRFIK